MPTWCRGRERNAPSRAGLAGAGVGELGLAPAPQAEEGDRSPAKGEEVLRTKLRKQGVSEALGRPCRFSLWIVMFWAL